MDYFVSAWIIVNIYINLKNFKLLNVVIINPFSKHCFILFKKMCDIDDLSLTIVNNHCKEENETKRALYISRWDIFITCVPYNKLRNLTDSSEHKFIAVCYKMRIFGIIFNGILKMKQLILFQINDQCRIDCVYSCIFSSDYHSLPYLGIVIYRDTSGVLVSYDARFNKFQRHDLLVSDSPPLSFNQKCTLTRQDGFDVDLQVMRINSEIHVSHVKSDFEHVKVDHSRFPMSYNLMQNLYKILLEFKNLPSCLMMIIYDYLSFIRPQDIL